jgi:hypothetical protein
MKTRFAALALLALPALCHAYSLDDAFQCNVSAHDFVAPLVAQRLIDPRPEPSTRIDSFRPLRGSHLTVLNFKVIRIYGYQPDDPIFAMPVLSSSPAVYGALVFGSVADVQASLNAIGSTAKAFHAGPHLTAIACRGV